MALDVGKRMTLFFTGFLFSSHFPQLLQAVSCRSAIQSKVEPFTVILDFFLLDRKLLVSSLPSSSCVPALGWGGPAYAGIIPARKTKTISGTIYTCEGL